MPQFTGARRRLEALLTLTVSRLAPCSGGTPTLCFVGSPDGKIARSDAWVASAVENRRLGHYPDGISGPAGLVECYRSCPENLRLSEKAKSEVGPFDSTRNGNVVLHSGRHASVSRLACISHCPVHGFSIATRSLSWHLVQIRSSFTWTIKGNGCDPAGLLVRAVILEKLHT